jgi:hypothetical protein
MMKLSAPQLKRLQVLYAQYSRRSIDLDASRECRIAWASQQLRHPVTSFSDLSKHDAHALIDQLQGALGIAPSKRRRPKKNDQAAGLEGRRDNAANTRTLPAQQDWDRISGALSRLGWNTAQYEAWLRSARSPLARKVGATRGVIRIPPTDITLRTLRDTNRVWWALKQMLKARGLWTA